MFYIKTVVMDGNITDLYWIYHEHPHKNPGYCIATVNDHNEILRNPKVPHIFVGDWCGEKVPLFIIKIFENLVGESINQYYIRFWKDSIINIHRYYD